MYICECCGNVVCDYELQTRKDFKPVEMTCHTDWCYETMNAPCECGGEFVEAVQCAVCGKYKEKDEYSVCDECLEEAETLENALEYGAEAEETIEINGFLAQVFSNTEIEEILVRELNNARNSFMKPFVQEMISEYVNEDRGTFSDFVDRRASERRNCN